MRSFGIGQHGRAPRSRAQSVFPLLSDGWPGLVNLPKRTGSLVSTGSGSRYNIAITTGIISCMWLFRACKHKGGYTLAPVAPKASAVALPIPLDPPVTRHTGASVPVHHNPGVKLTCIPSFLNRRLCRCSGRNGPDCACPCSCKADASEHLFAEHVQNSHTFAGADTTACGTSTYVTNSCISMLDWHLYLLFRSGQVQQHQQEQKACLHHSGWQLSSVRLLQLQRRPSPTCCNNTKSQACSPTESLSGRQQRLIRGNLRDLIWLGWEPDRCNIALEVRPHPAAIAV